MQFSSTYEIDGTPYRTVLYAQDRNHALTLLQYRNMGETLVPEAFPAPLMASDLINHWNFVDALHASCWLGMVGAKANTIDAFELMHDKGLIHTLSHLIRKKPEDFANPRDDLRFLVLIAYCQALRLERAIPGFRRYPEDFLTMIFKESIHYTAEKVRLAHPNWYETNKYLFKELDRA